MSGTIYVLGSINVDLMLAVNKIPEVGETLHGIEYLENFGGKGLNQVRAMSRLDKKVKMLGAVGNDMRGAQVLQSLRSWGIDDCFIEVIPDVATGLAFIIRTEEENRIILHAGANYAITEQLLYPLSSSASNDFFLAQLEVPYSIVLAGMKMAKARGLVTILNLAPARSNIDDMLPYLDYLIVNQTEMQILTGTYPLGLPDVEQGFKALKTLGLQRLIVTLGSDGVLYLDNSHSLVIPSYMINAIDTTGAGDAFVGAFVARVAEAVDMEEALCFANAAGAYTCLHLGVETAMGRREEIERLMKEARHE